MFLSKIFEARRSVATGSSDFPGVLRQRGSSTNDLAEHGGACLD